MDYVGFDFLKNKKTTDYVILEANPCPAHIINESPLAENTNTNISKLLLKYFFKDLK
jgi:D-alanine-D-alanine ligase-like ATP-grasp enzyme